LLVIAVEDVDEEPTGDHFLNDATSKAPTVLPSTLARARSSGGAGSGAKLALNQPWCTTLTYIISQTNYRQGGPWVSLVAV
jgi:hypothetical protein